jgi:histidinol-phosphate/aromatic aminotransferase/cobyric acid decarboxylase-like protein
MRQLDKALAEQSFDEDIPESVLEKILAFLPTPEKTTNYFIATRERQGITDVKRGELYPEILGGGTRLRRALGRVYGIDQVQAQANFGCSGCIDSFLTFIRHLELSGHHRNGLIVATPTYFRYHHKVESLGMRFLGVPFDEGYRYPVDRILAEIDKQHASALFLTTPNNPTGVPITDDDLCTMLDRIADDVYVAVDRTCANAKPEISTSTLLKKYSHKKLAIFHSFSKYHGLSHLRIGFSLVSDSKFAVELDRYRPFGLGLESLLRASYILTTQGELRPQSRVLKNIRENRAMIDNFLTTCGQYSCTDFSSNYALFFLAKKMDARHFYSRLASQGIFVMPGYELPEPDERYVRIHTAGSPLFIERLLSALKAFDKR